MLDRVKLARPSLPAVPALAAAAWAVLIVVHWPTSPLWVAHLAALETSLLGACFGVLGLALGLRRGGRPRWVLAVSFAATVVTLAVPLAAVPAYRRERVSFSFVDYVRWGPRPGVEVRRDVLLPGAPPGLELDWYAPAQPGLRPLVVTVHGGSWRGGDKGMGEGISRILAAAGYAVADVRYRLAPGAQFPVPVGDVKCQVGLLRAQASSLGIDPARVALLGRSAGAQIALLAAYSAGDPRVPPTCAVPDAPVSAVASFYAPTDLAWGYANPMWPDVVSATQSLESYLGGPPAARAEAYRLASPQSWVGRELPRTLLMHGTSDRLVSVEHARRLDAALRAAGRPVQLLEVPLADHGYDVRTGGVGEQLSRAVLLRFLAPL